MCVKINGLLIQNHHIPTVKKNCYQYLRIGPFNKLYSANVTKNVLKLDLFHKKIVVSKQNEKSTFSRHGCSKFDCL